MGMMGNFNQAVMEVNPAHPIVRDLARMVEGEGPDGEGPKNFATLLYDVAALTSGDEIEDSADFAQRILSMMSARAGGAVAEAEVVTSGVAEETAGDDTENAVDAKAEATPSGPELTAAQKEFFGQ